MKDDRWMMLTNPDKLDAGRMWLLEAMLGQFPLLKAGYEAKERFRAVWRAENMPAAQEAYDKWESDLPEDVRPAFNDLTTAMRNWPPKSSLTLIRGSRTPIRSPSTPWRKW